MMLSYVADFRQQVEIGRWRPGCRFPNTLSRPPSASDPADSDRGRNIDEFAGNKPRPSFPRDRPKDRSHRGSGSCRELSALGWQRPAFPDNPRAANSAMRRQDRKPPNRSINLLKVHFPPPTTGFPRAIRLGALPAEFVVGLIAQLFFPASPHGRCKGHGD